MSITISDTYLNQIKKVVTFPFSSKEILLTDEQIKDYCLFPAMEKYFNKFPVREIEEYSVSTGVEYSYDFPDDNTFGVLDARIVGKGMLLGSGGSFWDLVTFNSLMGRTHRGSGMYGKVGYNPNGLKQQILNQRWEVGSLNNLMTTSIWVDDENRALHVASSSSGKLNVTWAKLSENFTDVRQVYKWDVIELAQAYYLQQLADSAGLITNTMLEVQINVEGLKARAAEIFTKIETKWIAIPDIVLIRQT